MTKGSVVITDRNGHVLTSEAIVFSGEPSEKKLLEARRAAVSRAISRTGQFSCGNPDMRYITTEGFCL